MTIKVSAPKREKPSNLVTFSRDYLKDELGLPYDSYDDNVVIILNQESGSSRWSVYYDLIFSIGDQVFSTSYSRGATEIQDESPWEYESEVECYELQPLEFTYKNYKGEISEHRVIPLDTFYGTTEHHPEQQWLLKAYDLDKKARRNFAMKDILSLVSIGDIDYEQA